MPIKMCDMSLLFLFIEDFLDVYTGYSEKLGYGQQFEAV